MQQIFSSAQFGADFFLLRLLYQRLTHLRLVPDNFSPTLNSTHPLSPSQHTLREGMLATATVQRVTPAVVLCRLSGAGGLKAVLPAIFVSDARQPDAATADRDERVRWLQVACRSMLCGSFF